MRNLLKSISVLCLLSIISSCKESFEEKMHEHSNYQAKNQNPTPLQVKKIRLLFPNKSEIGLEEKSLRFTYSSIHDISEIKMKEQAISTMHFHPTTNVSYYSFVYKNKINTITKRYNKSGFCLPPLKLETSCILQTDKKNRSFSFVYDKMDEHIKSEKYYSLNKDTSSCSYSEIYGSFNYKETNNKVEYVLNYKEKSKYSDWEKKIHLEFNPKLLQFETEVLDHEKENQSLQKQQCYSIEEEGPLYKNPLENIPNYMLLCTFFMNGLESLDIRKEPFLYLLMLGQEEIKQKSTWLLVNGKGRDDVVIEVKQSRNNYPTEIEISSVDSKGKPVNFTYKFEYGS